MAAAQLPVPTTEDLERASLELVPTAPTDPDEIAQAAEHRMLRAALIGMAIGVVVCALIWMGIVAIALAGSDNSLAGPLAMAAGVGAFAGFLLGGWAGVVATCPALERAEHHIHKEQAERARR